MTSQVKYNLYSAHGFECVNHKGPSFSCTCDSLEHKLVHKKYGKLHLALHGQFLNLYSPKTLTKLVVDTSRIEHDPKDDVYNDFRNFCDFQWRGEMMIMLSGIQKKWNRCGSQFHKVEACSLAHQTTSWYGGELFKKLRCATMNDKTFFACDQVSWNGKHKTCYYAGGVGDEYRVGQSKQAPAMEHEYDWFDMQTSNG